jgi:hypothetical protein
MTECSCLCTETSHGYNVGTAMRAVFLLLCVTSLLGCDAYDASLLEGKAAGCGDEGSRRPPARPSPDGDGTDEVEEIMFAHRDVRFDQLPDDWREIGFDLDDRCSTPANALGECVPITGSTQEDGVAGIDNVFSAKLFALVSLQYMPRPEVPGDTLARYATDLHASGESALLIRIRNWNGLANDSRVTVDISSSVFGRSGTGDPDVAPSMTPCADGPGDDCVPGWAGDGDDWFWARSDNFLIDDVAQPKIVDDNAYVANDTVVMRIPDRAEIKFTGPSLGLSIILTDGISVGVISPDRMRMDSVMAGRWARNDLIQTAETVGVCAGSANYDFLLLALNDMLDVRSNRSTAGPDVECDALSMALPSTGYRAHFAGLATGDPVPNQCEGM